jgi:hypothetical protein
MKNNVQKMISAMEFIKDKVSSLDGVADGDLTGAEVTIPDYNDNYNDLRSHEMTAQFTAFKTPLEICEENILRKSKMAARLAGSKDHDNQVSGQHTPNELQTRLIQAGTSDIFRYKSKSMPKIIDEVVLDEDANQKSTV